MIVTGSATGRPPTPADVREAREHTRLPVFVGSGVDGENVGDFLPVCDGLIVGSHFKRDGHWANPVDADRARRFMDRVRVILEGGRPLHP